MKTSIAAVLFLAVAQFATAATKPAKASNLSEYKGNYSGTLSVTFQGSTPGFATTRGTISSAKKKDKGTINLVSTIDSGMPAAWIEKYAISNRNLTYTLSPGAGSFATGKGRVNVKSKTITYSATFVISGSTYFVRGTMKRSGKDGRKLKISETITGPTSVFITYNLTKRGKK